MILDFLDRKLAQAAVAEERFPQIDRLSRRALGILAGAVAFAGLSNTVRASGCTSLCGVVCQSSESIPCNSCDGVQCWEGVPDGMCCDYRCNEMEGGEMLGEESKGGEMFGLALCCSVHEGGACD